ncbi:hypothetical protein Tco_0129612 [Tanacetum coccineum]
MRRDWVSLRVWDAGMSALLDGFSTLDGSCLVVEIGPKWIRREAEIVEGEFLSRVQINGIKCWLSIQFGLWGEDYRLASEINRVVVEVNNVVIEKDQFLEELDSLGVWHVPAKMAEFLREI